MNKSASKKSIGGDNMATTFEQIVDNLSMDERKEVIRELFHRFDDVTDYFWYELAPSKCPELCKDLDIRRSTPSETYLYNIADRIWELGIQYRNLKMVDVSDDFHVDKETNTLTFSVTTLTACSDPSVNYYDSGEDSVNDFIKELKDIIQIENIEYVEDWDFDDYGSVTQSGNIVIKLGRK